jgi:hypothetical protein
MSDLIKIQIILLLIILPLFVLFLRKGLLGRAFNLLGLALEEVDFAPLKTILAGAIICLTIVLLRNIWLVLR